MLYYFPNGLTLSFRLISSFSCSIYIYYELNDFLLYRKLICENLAYLGVKIDEEANNVRGEERVISAADSKVKVMLIPTNEELAIARETLALVK